MDENPYKSPMALPEGSSQSLQWLKATTKGVVQVVFILLFAFFFWCAPVAILLDALFSQYANQIQKVIPFRLVAWGVAGAITFGLLVAFYRFRRRRSVPKN